MKTQDYSWYCMVDGIVYPQFVTEEKVNTMLTRFKTRNEDIFFVSYIKSGNTWLKQILLLLTHDGNQPNLTMMEAFPWLELCLPPSPDPAREHSYEYFESLPSPRILTFHGWPHLIPEGLPNTKYIFLIRNPKDVAVSMYHHLRGKKSISYQGNWDEFFELYLSGQIHYGSWFDFHLHWEKFLSSRQQVLYLTYEELQKNIKTCLRKLAAFLEIKVSEEVIDKVAIGSRLDEMKKNDKANCNWMIINQNEAPHLRKGIVGDWRNYFTDKQNQRFNDLYTKKMSRSKFKDYWDESILGITLEDYSLMDNG
ncbi:MAG: sulfotransferase domain-containing protein [Okeania sp. SIO2C9]|uniref:sulfotransferase domain-containing protein n=1 Tax=Okeania sp. SIO2C9 TaxID=2607791 RepID=UPI0013BED060|nr:sulfotransferase domain-containing protein [Okeania sp. SIO2C9]NEQ78112.1 sulfotransferase domain-containing protein [Okeania sp. SIO2C9]